MPGTKKIAVLSCVICLVAGLLVGSVLPTPWEKEASSNPGTIVQPPADSGSNGVNSSGSAAGSENAALDVSSNFNLLGTASYAVQVLKDKDYAALSSLVDPERGIAFTPYSTVEPKLDRVLTRQEVAALEQDAAVYTWGLYDGSGEPIQMTNEQYFERFVFNTDYTRASMIGIDRVLLTGNALENITDAYPGCRFVDYSIPDDEGVDWYSLKLVFRPGDTGWLLVGIVHGEWTI